jgi:hypothetical protein
MPESAPNPPKTISEIMEASWNDAVGQDTDDLPYENALEEAGSQKDTPPDQPPAEGKEGEGTPKEPAQAETGEGEQDGQDRSPDAVEVPSHWPEADRQMFAKMDKEAQQWLLNRHRQMEADYTRKTQENAEAVKVGTVVSRDLDPAIQQEMRRLGVSSEQFVGNLIHWHRFSTQDPAGFLRQVAQNLQVDPAQVFGLKQGEGAQQQQAPDPLTQRLAAVEQHLTQEQRARQTAIQENARTTLQQFAEEKDAGGQPLRPHYERVKPVMGRLMLADPSLDLAQAYEVAVFRDPELRQTIVQPPAAQQQQPPVDTKRIAEGERAARAAKANIRGKGGSAQTEKAQTGRMGLREAMAAAADEVGFN